MKLHRLLFAVAGCALAFGIARDGFERWIARTDLPVTLAETSVEMRGRDGRLMRAFDVENGRVRLAVAPGSVDPDFIDMLVTYEDKRFWTHSGVDMRAMARAVAQAVSSGAVVSGGSTLTMQVARLLENGTTGTVQGKLRQMRVAWALETRLSKAQILHLYLQHAPYGGRIEGVRSASQIWFGKEPARLSPSEAALLVALPQAPELRRPDRHPARAFAARNRVLARVGGAPSTARVPQAMRPLPRLAPHLADALRRADPGADRFETTLSPGLQIQIEALVKTHAAGLPRGGSAAVIVADHSSGEILAQLGAPHYSDASGALGFVDMTRAVRSPGSTLKPLVYALAFDRGLAHPATLIADQPTRFGAYAPQNFDGYFRGDVTVKQALTLSLNIPVVTLTEAIGADRLMATLRSFGADPRLPAGRAGLAVALGGVGVTLEDMVQIYAGLAQGGRARPLSTRPGAVPLGPRILQARSAWHVADILRTVPAPLNARAGLAYKTGTSYGHRDAWAIGFDGQHVIGVWMGRPDGTPIPGAFGGDHAAPLLFEAFGRLKATYSPLPPPPPDTLLLGTAALPHPLQRFGSGGQATFQGPSVVFPPDGAVLAAQHAVLKVHGGALPLTVLLNGAAIATGQRSREMDLGTLDIGFSQIAVIDARGQSARVSIETRP